MFFLQHWAGWGLVGYYGAAAVFVHLLILFLWVNLGVVEVLGEGGLPLIVDVSFGSGGCGGVVFRFKVPLARCASWGGGGATPVFGRYLSGWDDDGHRVSL